MSIPQFKALRRSIVVTLVLLFIQYELGMTVNMSDPAAIPPFGFSLPAVLGAINGVGVVAIAHATLGALLFVLAVVVLFMSFACKTWKVRVFGFLGFLSVAFSAGGGLFFVLSGFQNDHAGHTMATNFLLAFAFYFLELYFLRSEALPQKA